MKKVVLSLLVLLQCVLFNSAAEEPIFGIYGFSNHNSFEEYQQYVGRTVMYLPCEPLSYAESDVFKTQKFIPEAEYIVKSISPKSGKMESYSNLTIVFQEKNTKKKLTMRTYADWANQYPFVFIDDFNEDKNSWIGKSFTDPSVKGAYTIDDVRIDKPSSGKRIKDIQYYLSNKEIGVSFSTSDLEKGVEKQFDLDKSGEYVSSLVQVEKPEDSSDRYGNVQTIEDKGLTKYSFSDELIGIIIFNNGKEFVFNLTNKSQNSIKVVWDDAVFVNIDGASSRVMHSGIKYSQKEAPQPSSTIVRGSSLEDVACPIENVRYSSSLKEWVTDSMYPKYPSSDIKQVSFMLPIQIKEVVNEYLFIFDVKYIYNYPERMK